MSATLQRCIPGVLLVLLATTASAEAEQTVFQQPQAAARALTESARTDNVEALRAILGPGSDDIVDSGDAVADDRARNAFVKRADQQLGVERLAPDRAVVVVGDDAWPFPVPLVKGVVGWRFDAEAGAEEILNRRIGGNELHAIAVAQEYVRAQRELAQRRAAAGQPAAYAQRIASSDGQHDGLYWPTEEGETASPLGPLVARAESEGYDAPRPEGGGTFHGYRFRILTAQGAHAPGGARSYVHDGAMTGGFALVAYPAEYGVSGIMTFIVNQQGVVFEKDLGPDTEKLAEGITAYDPDPSWRPAVVE